MPHDAVNIDTLVMGDVRTHTVHVTGYDPGWGTIPNQVLLSRDLLKMPASVNNPIREDGTRAISAYWIQRILIQARPYSLSQSNPGYAYWVWYTKESPAATPNSTWSEPDLVARLLRNFVRARASTLVRINGPARAQLNAVSEST